MLNLSVADAIKNAAHLIAIGETTIYCYRDKAEGFPYGKVTSVESGSSYRLGGPSSCYLIAETAGLTFKLTVDFEGRDANGRGVAMFDRERLLELFTKLSPKARQSFADMLESECLPGMAERTAEIRTALLTQSASEDCVRGLIAFARQKEAA